MPIITLEVMPDSSMSIAETVPYENLYSEAQQNNIIDKEMKSANEMLFMDKNETTGMHFLVDKTEPTEINEQNADQVANVGSLNVRRDLLEYTTRSDGSVSCKVCGKILASRTHWYRHKYRAHAIHPVNPAPLFQCELCLIYFKSRKGYIGHIASKHSETLQDASPVLTNAQAEALAKEKSIIQKQPIEPNPILPEPDIIKSEAFQIGQTQTDPNELEMKKEPDPELCIPKSIVPTYQSVAVKQTSTKTNETSNKRNNRSTRQSMPRHVTVLEHAIEEQNERVARLSREEKLVADIIARVRRECEAQGSGGSTRRGYSRKTGLHT